MHPVQLTWPPLSAFWTPIAAKHQLHSTSLAGEKFEKIWKNDVFQRPSNAYILSHINSYQTWEYQNIEKCSFFSHASVAATPKRRAKEANWVFLSPNQELPSGQRALSWRHPDRTLGFGCIMPCHVVRMSVFCSASWLHSVKCQRASMSRCIAISIYTVNQCKS